MLRLQSVWVATALIFLLSAGALGQSVGDRHRLTRPGKEVPGHPAAGDHSVSTRFQDQAIATITAFDDASGWYQVDVDGTSAWIIKKYIGDRIDDTPASGPLDKCIVGAWNLEWFHDQKNDRGFPENTTGGPTWGARTDADYTAIAEVISNELQVSVLVLEEINAEVIQGDDESVTRSIELDRLLSKLGPQYDYVITRSGGDQHVAILFDKSKVSLNAWTEILIPEQKVQNKDIFERDPIIGYFSALSNGTAQNDFFIVGLHLKSGQTLNRNHDKAMEVLQQKLRQLPQQDSRFPSSESDIILGGDLNLNIFDGTREQELERMEAGDWTILAKPGYPGTRLAGVPLQPTSIIDYLITTDAMAGASGEIQATQASVRQDLASGGFDSFRQHFSDHFPVTVEVVVEVDDD